MNKCSDYEIERETITLEVHCTTRFFDEVIDWYHTNTYVLPGAREAEMFYKVLDFWGIPRDKTVVRSDPPTVLRKLDQVAHAIGEMTEAMKEQIENTRKMVSPHPRGLNGSDRFRGPFGPTGPPGRRGPPPAPGSSNRPRGPTGPH